MSRAAGSSGRRPVSRRKLLIVTGAIVVVVLAVVVVLRTTPPKRPTRLDLQNDPAFALRLPDSDVLLEVGSEAQEGIDGSTPAFAGHVFGTSATSTDVYAFYERELGRLGWHVQTPPYGIGSTELENRLYCRSGASFRLAIDDNERAFQPSLYKGRSYTTVFDATLLSSDPAAACPRPTLTPVPTIRR